MPESHRKAPHFGYRIIYRTINPEDYDMYFYHCDEVCINKSDIMGLKNQAIHFMKNYQ